MKVKATIENILFDSNGDLVVSFRARSVESKKWGTYLAKLQKTQEGNLQAVRIDVSKWKENRSLNANAYFHLLIDKIAKAVGIGAEECKRRMVLDYGTIATDESGASFVVTVPKSVRIEDYYPYARLIDESADSKMYIFYKHTHTLDSCEMAQLIEGVVQEAQQLGIDTMTPAEKEKMIARWQSEQKK
jgi:hypothetical protein